MGTKGGEEEVIGRDEGGGKRERRVYQGEEMGDMPLWNKLPVRLHRGRRHAASTYCSWSFPTVASI